MKVQMWDNEKKVMNYICSKCHRKIDNEGMYCKWCSERTTRDLSRDEAQILLRK